MKTIASFLAILTLLAAVAANTNLARSPQPVNKATPDYDVRAFGAKGDGRTLDTPAINRAIDAAAAAGGGTVEFPAGTYLSVSVHLKSNITLQIGLGNKAISLKNCRNVLLRDISILNGGHFALLATGVDNLTEREANYPEPSMFGETPAYGFFVRHAEGIEFNDVTVNYLNAEMRPPFFLEDVTSARFNSVTGYRALLVPMFVLRNVSDFNTRGCISVPDMHVDRIVKQNF